MDIKVQYLLTYRRRFSRLKIQDISYNVKHEIFALILHKIAYEEFVVISILFSHVCATDHSLRKVSLLD